MPSLKEIVMFDANRRQISAVSIFISVGSAETLPLLGSEQILYCINDILMSTHSVSFMRADTESQIVPDRRQ